MKVLNRAVSIAALLAAVAAAALITACVPAPPTQPTPITIDIDCINGACNNGGGGPSASPSPGTGTLPDGSTVRVGIFGHDCPSNVTSPNNGSGQIRVACRGAGITATPKGPGGVDLDPSVHGSQIEWQVTGGSATCTGSYLGEVFNQFCTCPPGSAGSTFALSAKVKNVTGVLNGSCIP